MWALAVQLYGVRSRRNWGHGDFTDLSALLDLAADLGAAGVGLNPLHALFDDRPSDASPYAPNSRPVRQFRSTSTWRRCRNFPACKPPGLEEEVERLRRSDIVDYDGRRKDEAAALELAYQAFRRQGTAETASCLRSFSQDRWINACPLWVLRVAAPEIRPSMVGMAERLAKGRR
jgi:4-alpha-glucanotransferase